MLIFGFGSVVVVEIWLYWDVKFNIEVCVNYVYLINLIFDIDYVYVVVYDGIILEFGIVWIVLLG